MNNPLISVIIPVYNVEKHLEKCLNSVINQTYKNLDIILINDGSTDKSGEICAEFSKRDSRIKFIQQENSGVSRARNVGIENSSGDFFSFIDSDDYLELDTYEYLINIVEEKQVDAVNYEYYITYPTNEVKHVNNRIQYGLASREQAQYELVNNVAFAWNKLFSKKLIGGLKFNEEVLRGEDSLFARQAFDKAESVWFDKRPLYHYVQSDESAVRGNFRKSQLTAANLYDIYFNFYSEKFPELLPYCISSLNNLMVSLYYDMWSDKGNYKNEQKHIVKIFKKYFKITLSCKVSNKQRLKSYIFYLSPFIYCLLHRTIFKF